MRLKSLRELLGSDVLVQDERIGALYDVYLDRDSALVPYLVVGTAPRRFLLVSTGIALHDARAGVRLALSLAQLQCGAGACPLDAASAWLQHRRLCRGSEVLGYSAEAQDGGAGVLFDILIDDEAWSVDYVVVDWRPEGGVGKRLVPLHWVAAIDVARHVVRVRSTRAELADSPPP
jgi:hypothetical protein